MHKDNSASLTTSKRESVSPSCLLTPPSVGHVTSPSVSHLTGSAMWADHDEAELSELISLLVEGHRETVTDINSVSDEYLQEQFKECSVSCRAGSMIFMELER